MHGTVLAPNLGYKIILSSQDSVIGLEIKLLSSVVIKSDFSWYTRS